MFSKIVIQDPSFWQVWCFVSRISGPKLSCSSLVCVVPLVVSMTLFLFISLTPLSFSLNSLLFSQKGLFQGSASHKVIKILQFPPRRNSLLPVPTEVQVPGNIMYPMLTYSDHLCQKFENKVFNHHSFGFYVLEYAFGVINLVNC